MKHLILGAGAAGLAAAKTIRERRPDDEIVVISADERVHSRCMLHHYIAGERDEEGLRFVEADFFDKHRIRWIPGKAVTGVDTVERLVRYEGGQERYDKLLVATGANSAMPPIPGMDALNVFGLRHLSDAQAIRREADSAAKVVVVGAGLVGLDAAHGLLAMGKEVTVVEMEPRVLALNLDQHAAAEYQRRFEAAGCRFRLGVRVKEALLRNGKAVVLQLDNGEQLDCDLVVVAAGVRPAVEALAGSGIACERSVTVDETLGTSAPDVWAAGDVAGLSGIWSSAVKQGEVAARNMCGEPTVYDDRFALKNTVNFYGLLTLSVGRLNPAEGDEVLVREDRRRYEKLILRDGRIMGVILQGEIGNSGFWQYLIGRGIDVTGRRESPWKLSYADWCSVDERGEYQWKTS